MKKLISLVLISILLFPLTQTMAVSISINDNVASSTIIMKKFELKPLPYSYDALEPYIDAETMMLHHDKHHQSYVDNLNNALSKHPDIQFNSLEELLLNVDKLPADIQIAIKNNAGGVYNHNFFWTIMGPNKGGSPTEDLGRAIERDFGSFKAFKDEFKKAALGRFGSGWAWLASDKDGKLSIVSTANQDTLLPLGLTPIIVIDVWEHAYYLKYQNRRADYIENWWNVVDWNKAQENYKNRK